jgi:hypothetical protein
MKITKSDYEALRTAVLPFMPAGAAERERWDALWASEFDVMPLYTYLNDDHIDTALRAIAGNRGDCQRGQLMTTLNANWTKKLGEDAPKFEFSLEKMFHGIEKLMDSRYFRTESEAKAAPETGKRFGAWQRPDLSIEPGSKYLKIVAKDSPKRRADHGITPSNYLSAHVVGFIGLGGEIYMPASWRKPALNGARGNIFDSDNGVSAWNDMGRVNYKGCS